MDAAEVFINPNPPPQPQSPTPAPTPVKPKSNLFMKVATYMLVLITLAYGSFLGILVAASYTGWKPPLIPKNTVRIVDSGLAAVPFIPKTPKQVLTRSFAISDKIKSGVQKFSLEISSSGSSQPRQNISVRLSVKAPFKVVNENTTNVEAETNLELDFAGTRSKYSANFVAIDKNVYFKLGDIPGFKKISNKWYRVDLEKIQKDLNVSTQGDEEAKEGLKEQTERLFDALDKHQIFKKIKRLSDEDVSGRTSYHYQLDLAKEELEAILKTYSDGNAKVGEVEKVRLDLWVDKSKFYLNKFGIEGSIVYGAPTDSSLNLSLPKRLEFKFKFIHELSEINKEIVIEAPEKSEEIESIFEILLPALPITPTSQGVRTLGTTDPAYEVGKNILTVEKITRVLYSIPKALSALY